MAEAAYLTLKLARELYRKSPGGLAPEERRRVDKVALRQQQIEARILATPEAAAVVLPASALAQSLAEIRGRYAGEDEFHADLGDNGLNEAELRRALERDLVVEAVLEGVASRTGAVGDADVEIFYLMHRDRFRQPETRSLRHVLVTINESVATSSRAAALAKIEAIRERLRKSPERFEEQALKHSECPTALNGGLLGDLPRGKLFPELEPAAFALAAGELSAVLESPLGFHVLRCDAIKAEQVLPLEAVIERLRSHLDDNRRQKAQKAWIAGLFAAG
jgi:peptidylprolyl isomerase/peptidyl-prolyl cis-trans isomerase C